MNRLSPRQIALYLLAIFAAGALAGSVAGYSFARQEQSVEVRPDELAERIKRRMQSKLNLTPEQVRQIEPNVQAVCSRLRSIGHSSALETSKAFERFNDDIAAFLTTEQERELEKFRVERNESFKRRCKSWTNANPAKASR